MDEALLPWSQSISEFFSPPPLTDSSAGAVFCSLLRTGFRGAITIVRSAAKDSATMNKSSIAARKLGTPLVSSAHNAFR